MKEKWVDTGVNAVNKQQQKNSCHLENKGPLV